MAIKKKLIGRIGVDSGQIVICDPCYIDSHWRHDDEYKRDQVFRIFWNGRLSYYDMGEAIEAGILFTTPLSDFEGMTMNELIKEGHATEEPVKQTGVFGYNGCCRASQAGGGELGNGLGVAASTYMGDGLYPVYAHCDEGGNILKIEVDFR